MRYNDPQHIRNYSRGEFPAIHNDIFSLIRRYVQPTDTVMDLGACLGLLSARMVDKLGVKKVIAIEPSRVNLSRAIQKPEIEYYARHVTFESMNVINAIMKKGKPSIVVARRVFPEIAEKHGAKTVKLFAYNARANGVKYIILEGRIPVSTAKNVLSTADKEVEALAPYYVPIESYGHVRVLKARMVQQNEVV